MVNRTRLTYNERTGMFEDASVGGGGTSSFLRVLFLPFKVILLLLCIPVRFLQKLLKLPIVVLKQVWLFFKQKSIIFLRLFFSPAIKLWFIIKRDWRDGEYVFVGLWLIPAYILILIYKSLIFWMLDIVWSFLATIIVCLWRWLCVACIFMKDFFSSLFVMVTN